MPSKKPSKGKQADISRIPPPIPPRPSKSVLSKSKFYKKIQASNLTPSSHNRSYAQASKSNINEIIKIKDTFPKLPPNKVLDIHNMIIMSNSNNKGKPKLNMTTKGPSRKQIIVPMSMNNTEKVLANSNVHVANINRLLKGIKSKISADFIHSDNKGVIITTNKVASTSDMNIMEKYVKELNDVNLNNIMSSRLLQSKLYLKILSIPYFIDVKIVESGLSFLLFSFSFYFSFNLFFIF